MLTSLSLGPFTLKMASSTSKSSAASRLRSLLADKTKIVAAPGVYDGLTARIALDVGFDALYMTGAGTSMSRTGWADLGLATATEMIDNARLLSNLDPQIPVIADADTGYGAPINVARTVADYIRAGVAALHIEDQVVNKKCGHLAGKQCVSKEEYVLRIRAAVLTRQKLGSDIVIIARSDALQPLGIDDAIDRLKAAVAAGADVAFLEACTQREECVKFCQELKGTPLMYGLVQGTKSYRMTAAEAREMGYSIIVYAGACLGPVYSVVNESLSNLKRNGDCDHSSSGLSPLQLFNVCGMKELLSFDKEVAVGVSM